VRPFRRRLAIKFAALMRWTHIYVSMFGLAVTLFFSLTGITLNHPDWFFTGSERSVQAEGTLNRSWLASSSSARAQPAEAKQSREVAKLEIVEHFRRAHGVRGALAEFRVEDEECQVTFKGPGYAADAFINRATGHYSLTQSFHGFIAVINDLHKGRDTGPGWSLLIDISAALLTLISLSGLTLLFYLKLRRIPGVIVTVIGTIVVVAVYLIWVP
jgi:hypothetical protein